MRVGGRLRYRQVAWVHWRAIEGPLISRDFHRHAYGAKHLP